MTDDIEIPASNGEGWDFFTKKQDEAIEAAAKRIQIEREEIDRAYARMFNTPDGQIVLKHMELTLDHLEDFNPQLGFYNGAAFGFRRTGWRDALKHIKNAIVRGAKA